MTGQGWSSPHEGGPHLAGLLGAPEQRALGMSRGAGVGRLSERVRADGRHLSAAGLPFRVKGVTYGSFTPRSDGQLFPEPARLAADLRAMASAGLNLLRTYTTPPAELLELADELGLRVLAGVHYDDWRQQGTGRRAHAGVLDAGRRALDEALERVAGRPGVLALSVGNEVPGDLVRLHGIHPVERVLSRLVDHVHAADPALLATYSNFPTTEYLHVDGLDLTCFNVFLEDPAKLRAYLRHLQVVAGDTPLLVTELGLAGEVHGEQAQAASLAAQLRTVDETGCAGATVFSWTDEWGVAGQPVEGWGFGVTREDRSGKPALEVVRQWANRDLRDLRRAWPALSVIVCAYNEAALLEECLSSLDGLDYPGLEVVVCDDGSTDGTLEIAQGYPFTVLALPHRGLSAARNAGARAAHGEYVAYLDADAHCHPEWPYHLVLSMEDEGVVATGGPNLPVPGVGFVERIVGACPGRPVEVLVGDDRAEHVPGCNMAFRHDDLLAVGGFDAVFTSAGDDVDVCWRLLDRGGQIAFAPAAQVRHHRRSTVKGYLKQQRGYGRSERMVSARHPHRFNRLGQARWSGSIYGGLRMLPSVLRPVVYHGPLGGAPYQSVAARPGEAFFGWYAALLPLAVPVGMLGLLLALVVPTLLALPALAVLVIAAYAATVLATATPPRGESQRWRWRALVAFLHVAQPFVRIWGRLREPGLDPLPRPPSPAWSGDRLRWLLDLERTLTSRGLSARFAGPSSSWDLAASVGLLLEARITTAVRWSWTPSAAIRLRLRPLQAAAFVALAAALLLSGLPGTVAVGGAVVAVVVELAVLMVRVRAAVRRSTTRARVQAEAAPRLTVPG